MNEELNVFQSILYPVLSIGGLGVLFGAGLGFAGVKFKVEQDERIPLVRECLPGANCGGCGFAGCDAFAEAVVSGKAKTNGCPVGGASVGAKVAAVMGLEASETEKMVAFVKCNGNCEVSSSKYNYYGMEDCSMENALAGGAKGCSYGCLGDGNCVKACNFGAISIVNGVAVVDKEKCTACGQCVAVCPKQLIEIIPYKSKVHVSCNSKDNGKNVRANCSVGCIGCTLCQKNCKFDAVYIENFLAKIDYSKCVSCGICTQKCPTKAISKEGSQNKVIPVDKEKEDVQRV